MIRLELADIQGNIYRPYGRFGFPHSRHLFFNFADATEGRRFVQGVRKNVTTAEPWDKNEQGAVKKPPITLNIGFSYQGLRALDLPTRTLRLMPDEFIDGMFCRADILGDAGGSAPEHWDRAWNQPPHELARQVHLWVSLNAAGKADGTPVDEMAQWTTWLESLVAASGGMVTLLDGHGSDGTGKWQDSRAIMDAANRPLPMEHFGFIDGISDPAFNGQFPDPEAEALAVVGGGKIAEGPYDVAKSWSALEAGEFILGQVDEGQEQPTATMPAGFVRNGTFVVWRKLKQDVAAFDADIARQAEQWMRVQGTSDREEAAQTVRAKMVGRWWTGIPLIAAPTWAEHQAMMPEYAACVALTLKTPRDAADTQRLAKFDLMLRGFRYGDDPDGAKCPLGAHIRRGNPRDMLDPDLSAITGASTLTNRRRIMRRGLPYDDGGGEKGVIFMAICASLFRQFEFIQQQWMNYGLDFDAGNDTCPLIGNRSLKTDTQAIDKHVIPAGPAGAATFIAADLKEYVLTRGGDYFFLPSITAIRMIAMGTVDPT